MFVKGFVNVVHFELVSRKCDSREFSSFTDQQNSDSINIKIFVDGKKKHIAKTLRYIYVSKKV